MRMQGFQEHAPKPEEWSAPGMAMISYPEPQDRRLAACSCGWLYGCTREKVLEDAIDRHLDKRHEGRGIRL